jgi:hypothetical protein
MWGYGYSLKKNLETMAVFTRVSESIHGGIIIIGATVPWWSLPYANSLQLRYPFPETLVRATIIPPSHAPDDRETQKNLSPLVSSLFFFFF